MIADYRILDRPCGFELSAITARVTIWQGDADGFVPLGAATRLTHSSSAASVCAGAGHFLAYDRYRQIFTDLIAQGPTATGG